MNVKQLSWLGIRCTRVYESSVVKSLFWQYGHVRGVHCGRSRLCESETLFVPVQSLCGFCIVMSNARSVMYVLSSKFKEKVPLVHISPA